MRPNKAFTLIEVMVVLSILAIIAILAYNFFGGTMREATSKQATTKIYNDMRTIADAADLYRINFGALPADKDAILASGLLKSWPTPPAATYDGAGLYEYAYVSGYDDFDGGGSIDDAVQLSNLDITVCAELNNAYAPTIGSVVWDHMSNGYPEVSLGKGTPFFCLKWGSADVTDGEVIFRTSFE